LGCARPSLHRCPLPCVHVLLRRCAIFSAYTVFPSLEGMKGERA
jgi:hypothetical protein